MRLRALLAAGAGGGPEPEGGAAADWTGPLGSGAAHAEAWPGGRHLWSD